MEERGRKEGRKIEEGRKEGGERERGGKEKTCLNVNNVSRFGNCSISGVIDSGPLNDYKITHTRSVTGYTTPLPPRGARYFLIIQRLLLLTYTLQMILIVRH